MSNKSIVLGNFLPSSLLQQSTSIRRLTSTSEDSEDSGVDSSYRQERKIFVGGVPSSVGPEELAQFFQSYGTVEEAFIIYDRYTGRHRGFGFVTFADMSTTTKVCSTRVFNLHGRKIECKRALKREQILGLNETDSNDYKSFRPNLDKTNSNVLLNSSTYGEYNQSSSFINPISGWIVNPSIQQIYQPMLNQQYAVFPLSSTLMWTNPYQIPSPFVQEMMFPCSSPMINF